MRVLRWITLGIAATVLSACGSTPDAPTRGNSSSPMMMTPIPKGTLALPDRVAYLQKDVRWAKERLGGTGETLASDGCVVTSAAMALTNLGFTVDPGELNARFKQNGSYTKQGWLIWDGVRKVTGGRAEARFYKSVNAEIIDGCLRDGYYPLTRFILPNGRSHWAMVVGRDARGYRMRDPLRPSKSALIFPRGADAFKSVRCIGVKDGA